VNPLINEIWDQVAGSWRFRWVAVATAAALALAGWLVVFGLQDRYEAGASVFVDTHTQGLGGNEDVDAELNFVRQSLLADPSLQRIAREGGVLPAVSTDFQQQALLVQMRQRIDISVHSGNGHEEERNTAGSIYHIAYQDHDLARSLQVVRVLLETLVNNTLTSNRERSEEVQQVLTQQIAEYEKRLQTVEGKLADFKRQNPELVAATGDYFTRRQAATDDLHKLRLVLTLAEEKRTALQRQLSSEPAVVDRPPAAGAAPAGAAGDTAIEIRKTQAQLKELLLRYTDKHPDVIAAREALEDLTKRQQAEIAAVRRGDPGAITTPGLAPNPAYEEIRLRLGQADIEVAAAKSQVEDQEAKIAELQKMINTAPEVEAVFEQLKRDYDADTELLRKARNSQGAGTAPSVRFRVVQPPAVAYGPAWPRRRLWLTAILAGALAAGAALAYGLNYLYPVVSSAEALARAMTVPLLGQVTAAFPERERRALRRELLRISMATACLFVAFGVAIVLSQSGYRLNIAALSSR
jgi:polysaccharide chain length determinant protein (PEP-CTERM system associated)